MPRLIIRPDALKHNLATVDTLCRRAGAKCMFVLKEAPLHAELVRTVMKDSGVRDLGLTAWPGLPMPLLPGIAVHHVYAPFPHNCAAAAKADTVFLSSTWSMQRLAGCRSGASIRLVLEAGDGRDGASAEELPSLCHEAHRLGLHIRGIAVNFACMSREAPSRTALLAASEALQAIRRHCAPEADVSAGGTDVLELAGTSPLPDIVRELRCGTGVTLGAYPLSGMPIPDTRQDAFRLEADVLEYRIKQGRRMALMDFGAFHTAPENLSPPFPGMAFKSASSAYSVFDVTDCSETFREGMSVTFRFNCRSLALALASRALTVIQEQL